MTEKMDRGTEALKAHLSDSQTMTFRQACSQCIDATRLSWCRLCSCTAPPARVQVFVGEDQVAEALEDANGRCRYWCAPIHPFTAEVKELDSKNDAITIHRPLRCPICCCKCCCYQEATVTSGGQVLGSMKEDCFVCVPSFQVNAPDGSPIYKIHPPTCWDGRCIDCCMKDYPYCCEGCCNHKHTEEPFFACCRLAFHVFPASQEDTGDLAPCIGKIFKPFGNTVERRADCFAVEISFPEGATPQEKGLLMGSAIFLNVNFFEDPAN